MLDPNDLNRKATRLRHLARTKFGVGGDTLEVAMRRVGRRVPKRIQSQAKIVIKAQKALGHPKLWMQVDAGRVEQAFRIVEAHLQSVDPDDRRKGFLLSMLGSLVFNLMLLAALLVLLLIWRGFVQI